MDAYNRTVDHLHLAIVGLDHGIHQAIPNSGLAPTVEPIVGGRVRPVALRQVAPGSAGTQDPKDAVENTAVLARLAASAVLGKKRFDDTPFEICQVVAHDPSPDAS